MQTNTTTTDGWFKRRMMRLTNMEKRAMNNTRHSIQTEKTALSLLGHVSLGEKPYCLEIGCGQGALARLLAERFDARVVASDADPDQVALARHRTPGLDDQIEFRVIDARYLPFESQHFEAVFSFGVLHHIPGDWQKVVTEVHRVLKPGGWFIFTDFPIMPGPGQLFKKLFPRFGQLEENAMLSCLAENHLQLKHYAYGRNLMLGLMRYCMAVAQSEKASALPHKER